MFLSGPRVRRWKLDRVPPEADWRVVPDVEVGQRGALGGGVVSVDGRVEGNGWGGVMLAGSSSAPKARPRLPSQPAPGFCFPN